MKEVAFIIPGYQYTSDLPEYQEIARYFRRVNITPILIDVPWKRKTMTEYVNFFLEEYKKVKADKIYVFGFSFGAMISFIASTRVKIDIQILASLSPYFKENLPFMRKWWLKSLGTRRELDFYLFSYRNLVSEINSETILLYGSKETADVKANVKNIFPLLSSANLVEVVGVKHDISDERYLRAVKEVVSNFGVENKIG